MAKEVKRNSPRRVTSELENELEVGAVLNWADWWRRLSRASGLYRGQENLVRPLPGGAGWLFGYPESSALPSEQGEPAEISELQAGGAGLGPDAWPRPVVEELRLDVDGRYPLMTASGTMTAGLRISVHWIASLTGMGRDKYKGKIWYKDTHGTPFPFTHVEIEVLHSQYGASRKAIVTFIYGETKCKRGYQFVSSYFYPLSLEYDYASGTAPVTTIDTHIHPTYPSDLPQETISIETVYRRAGFDVKTGGQGPVPLSLTGTDGIWSNSELHDAMQVYWSRFQNAPQWAAWVMFAAAHEEGAGLAGIMFDDIGPNHRQGTSIFLDSTLFHPDPGITQTADWEQRYKFWCACHELGHCFNIAHSWQKDFPLFGSSWIPLTNNTASTSFMNYPFYYPAGPGGMGNSETDYFSNFRYRFDGSELLFMRHAPARFVQPGNADWFDHHGFRQADTNERPMLSLEVRANRDTPVFQYLEPIVLELKLKNVSTQPVIMDAKLLARIHAMTIVIKKDGQPARQFLPYAHYDFQGEPRVLNPSEAAYESLFVSAGRNGWDLADPGYYTVQVCLHLAGRDVLSHPFRLRIEPPRERAEEYWAQDFFSEDVGRILTFDGSRILKSGLTTLRKTAGALKDHPVSYHANVALAIAEARAYKLLDLPTPKRPFMSAGEAGAKVVPDKPDVKTARKEFAEALTTDTEQAARSLGHVDYKWYVDRFTDWLADQGQEAEASTVQDTMYNTLKGRGVLTSVLDAIAEKRSRYGKKTGK